MAPWTDSYARVDDERQQALSFRWPQWLPGKRRSRTTLQWPSSSARPQHLLIIVAALALALIILVVTSSASGPGLPHEDVLHYIDPLIGTLGGGHVFPGATLPFGMAKAVADVSSNHFGGFSPDHSSVQGFSHLHDSGTGGSPSMGTFPIFIQPKCNPEQGCGLDKFSRRLGYDRASVRAVPGYFALDLDSGVRAEMTVSRKAALYKFTFIHDKDNKSSTPHDLMPTITADASDLPGTLGNRSMHVDPTTGRFTGEGEYEASFGEGLYKVYFCSDIRGAAVSAVGTWNGTLHPGEVSVTGKGVTGRSANTRQLVYATLSGVQPMDELYVRVGMSWISRERACNNAETEIRDWDFARLRDEATQAWRTKLQPIRINSEGVDRQHLRNFWSGIYRALLSPQDYTGENPMWNSTEPHYESYYCIWDTFRGVHPFYTILDPKEHSRIVRSLIDISNHEGWLPDCRMSFRKGFTQGGSNADVVLVDSFLKGLQDVDWDDAYAAIVKDAEEQPPNWGVEGRGGLESWKTLGYIPFTDYDDKGKGLRTRSISRTMEYAFNDFCIAEMANATGRYQDYDKYIARASNWKNLMNPDVESMDFTGFPQPKWKNGTWAYQSPTLCSHLEKFDGCYLYDTGHETYEGSPWLYNFYVPGDYAGLIDMTGGKDKFLQKLSKLHDSGVLDMGDEQAFLMAMLFHWAGRPALSAAKTHEYIPSMYSDKLDGIPGNDDSGAMGTFVLFSMLGLFPVAGTRVYLITPPYFPSISITNPITHKTATIRNVNFDPEYKNIFIQSAKLNGQPYTKNWIDHAFFTDGWTLELVLGEEESTWGTRDEDLPPSLSTGLYLGV